MAIAKPDTIVTVTAPGQPVVKRKLIELESDLRRFVSDDTVDMNMLLLEHKDFHAHVTIRVRGVPLTIKKV